VSNFISNCGIDLTLTAHIATVGKALASSEEKAYPIMLQHDVSYVLVIAGALIQYSGDDLNKFLWMIRISSGVWPDEIQESNYYNARGEFRIDETAAKAMKESIMHKMSYYRSVTCPWRDGGVKRLTWVQFKASRSSSHPDRRRTVCGTRSFPWRAQS